MNCPCGGTGPVCTDEHVEPAPGPLVVKSVRARVTVLDHDGVEREISEVAEFRYVHEAREFVDGLVDGTIVIGGTFEPVEGIVESASRLRPSDFAP